MEFDYVGVRRDSSLKNAWSQCVYCEDLCFKSLPDFTRHLREKHCTIEGGSFVCRYGYNSVCNSLPVEGVSDSDYVDHVYKHHAFSQVITHHKEENNSRMNRKLSTSSQHSTSSESSNQWTIFSASQNLAAVLNDPNRGKQKDFFTKLWGVDFVEKTVADIPKHPYLPDINHTHFESYLRKISKRHKRHLKFNEDISTSKSGQFASNDILQLFPKLRLQRSLSVERRVDEKPEIPAIFLQSDFDISKPETFYIVFPFAKDDRPGGQSFQQNGKLLQEKLTHDLDQVEVLIAEQVAQKSDAFFQAMTSHDSLMDQLARTLSVVKSLRKQIAIIDECLAKQSLHILQLQRRKYNHLLVLQKLKLMSTVHQTQPTIQTLLSTSDYVAALELISTTQELLNEELQGIHSFRHLSSQLNEINRLIDMMMSTEFENYSTKDLNRPFTEDSQVLEGEKLVSIMLGMLRRRNTKFISKYKQESFTTIKTMVKQLILEALADNDCDADGPYNIEQVQSLDLNKWIELMDDITVNLVKLLKRIKALHDVMKDTANMAAGYPNSSHRTKTSTEGNNATAAVDGSLKKSSDGETITESYDKKSDLDCDVTFLNVKEYGVIINDLKELLISVCDFSHDECAKLFTLAKNKPPDDKPNKGGDKTTLNGSASIFDNVNSKQIHRLAKIIENFTSECEKISCKSSTSLKSAFQVQANKFVNKFHNERRDKLSLILKNECWRPAEVRSAFQGFVEGVRETKAISRNAFESPAKGKPESFLVIDDEKYIVVGAVLLLMQMITEYTNLAEDLSALTFNILRNLAELLSHFNSRSCQLILGAGALQTVGLKTITTTNLVLASRSLQLIVWFLPFIKSHFDELLKSTNQTAGSGSSNNSKNSSSTNVLNEVEINMKDHINKLHGKVVAIVSSVVANEVVSWGAKPPVPSSSFRNISKHLTKLHEAVAGVLPSNQIEEIYKSIHDSFKGALREQLKKLNIVNNGGPQHGTVTSELIFYMEMLKKLHVFSTEDFSEHSLDDIWMSK